MQTNVRHSFRVTLLAATLFAGLACKSALALTLGGGVRELVLTGPIEAGDADKIVAAVRGRRFPPPAFAINSPGGSVVESIRIAQIVKKLAVSVTVVHGGQCASACFMVFAAGAGRSALPAELMSPEAQRRTNELAIKVTGKPANSPGPVGLHRPYQANILSADNDQVKVMKFLSAYLEEEMVPKRLVELMMTHPSNDIYWLSADDLKQLGEYAPAMEEFLINRCGYDRNLADKIMSSKGNSSSLIAQGDRADDCIGRETGELTARGFADIQKGWRAGPIKF
jgi:hypothetical protein